jgi:hypothetical protein
MYDVQPNLNFRNFEVAASRIGACPDELGACPQKISPFLILGPFELRNLNFEIAAPWPILKN